MSVIVGTDSFDKSDRLFDTEGFLLSARINYNIDFNEEPNFPTEIKKPEIKDKDTIQSSTIKPVIFTLKKSSLGRKRKNSGRKGLHNKYSRDNVIRKIKSKLIKLLINVINQLINKLYNENIGYGPFIKKILPLNQSQIINSKNDNEFIYKTMKDILSDKITGKFYNYCPEHNKNLIELLLNEEDIQKKEIFENFFNLKFIDCLEHYIGKAKITILKGMETLNETCINIMIIDNDENYKQIYKFYAQNFVNIILNKKKRIKK